MYLSELIYQVVKNAIYYENNASFSKMAIRRYSYALTTNQEDEEGLTIDSDYKKNVDNVFLAVNQAIQRVASLDKLATRIKVVETKDIQNNIIDLSGINASYILNVYYLINSRTERNIEFNKRAKNQIYITKKLPPSILCVHVEYYPEVPFFDYTDIQYHYDVNDELVVDEDIDLQEIGISNLTCSFIILWCKGTLGRDIYGQEADIWVNQAEQYFLDLPVYGGELVHDPREVEDIYFSW